MVSKPRSAVKGWGSLGHMVGPDAVFPSPSGQVEGESALASAAKSGDCEAFLMVLEAHDRVLRSLAFRMLGDRDQMDDVLQEVALKAFRALPKFRGDASLATWLYRITYTTCLNTLRSGGRNVSLPDPEDDPPATMAAHLFSGDTADAVIRRVELSAALASLSAEQRAVVALVFEEGLDHKTAASVLGIPTGTVASRVAAARAALRRFLTEPPSWGETV